jgi:hypothetical protein
MRLLRLLINGLLLAAIAGSACDASAALKVGVTGAVDPQTFGIPPDADQRVLIAGDDVAFKEEIDTKEDGRAEILFLDRSSLSVGPNARVVIDDFVYSPQNDTGSLVIRAMEGVFRYVGGALSKNENAVTIETPTAVVGIRGGIAVVEVARDGATTATFVYGKALTIRSTNGTFMRISRPGFFSTVTRGGAAPTPPAKATVAQITNAIGKLQSSTAKTSTVVQTAVTKAPAAIAITQVKTTAAAAIVKATTARKPVTLSVAPAKGKKTKK